MCMVSEVGTVTSLTHSYGTVRIVSSGASLLRSVGVSAVVGVSSVVEDVSDVVSVSL